MNRIATSLGVLLCAGCGAGSLRSGPLPAFTASGPLRFLSNHERSLLYIGSAKLSEYALGSSEPLRSTKINYNVSRAILALDSSRHYLIEANGNPSYAQILVYDTRNLSLVHTFSGAGDFISLAADKSGYLYAGPESFIGVYAAGATRYLGSISRGARSVGPLVFDRAGKLYAGNMEGRSVSVYAPRPNNWRMKFLRSIHAGVHTPFALALGPSGELFVASWPFHNPGWVSVYPPDASKPERTITSGVDGPQALAVDSQGRLYVGNAQLQSFHRRMWRGWVSVYAPGGTQPIRKITDGIYTPEYLAVAPDGDLFVGNLYAGVSKGRTTVTVYSPGGSKLLYAITEGISGPPTLLIGSP